MLLCFLKIIISVCSAWFKKIRKHCHGKDRMPILTLYNMLPFLMHACTLSDHRAVATYGSILFLCDFSVPCQDEILEVMVESFYVSCIRY